MSIALVTKYEKYTDEIFTTESKTGLITNNDFDWSGAKTVKVYKISTAELNDYERNRSASDESETVPPISRYGEIYDLGASTESFLISKDRSFIFNIDTLDTDETQRELDASTALAREIREVVIPELDTYVLGEMVDGAGTTADPITLEVDSIYDAIIAGSETLDENEVPETGRYLVVSPGVFRLLKGEGIFDQTELGLSARLSGNFPTVDGMPVIRVPSSRLPQDFGFMICHPCATVAPVKLADYGIHVDTPLSSGAIVTGRICYDAFVLENKAKAIYVQPVGPSGATGATGA